jgi:Mg-chelatase subunit ChlD
MGTGDQAGSPHGAKDGVLDAEGSSGYESSSVALSGKPDASGISSDETATMKSEGHSDSAVAETTYVLEGEETTRAFGSDDDDIEESLQSTAMLSRVPNRQSSGGVNAGPLGGVAVKSGGLDSDLEANGGINPFLGEGKSADSTVFVIDVSGSMQSADRLPRVLRALMRAIDQLKSNQRLCILLFDDGYYAYPMVRLVAASGRNKMEIRNWLSRPPGGGGTNPMPALEVAVDLNPERIVLLSDGEFAPWVAQHVTELNHTKRKPARIDCVGLMEQVEVLQEIAKYNKGIYYQAW